MGEVADAEGWGHSTSTEAFPGVRRRRRERPRRPFAAVEPVEHFHQRRDRPDVALGDELASSALNLAKANPRLRPLHLLVRETEFCGLRLAGYFRRRIELVAAEIDLLRRAIAEIKALREKLDERRATQSIAAEDLNASNDE